MSTIDHYRSNLADTFFNLFEVLDVEESSFGVGPFQGMDADTAEELIRALENLVMEDFAPGFAEADRTPLELDDEGNVTIPACVHRAIDAYFRDGWDKMEMPEHLGGFGAPPSLIWAAFEMGVSAHPAAAFYLLGAFIAKIIDRLGTESQKTRYVNNMMEHHWGGSMCLTEPDAGSDVGAGTSSARQLEGDVWELEGTKRFITNGDYDRTDNIVHLVLARPEGHGGGTKGLSMFIVPKYWVHEDGSLGERNGAVVTAVEDKMGLKASATCELVMGGNIPCRGLLVGETHRGISQMFNVIEYARMAVAVKSMGTLSTAYLNALEYAKDRVQGPDLTKALDKSSPRVRIIQHPDVRRMLMHQKAHAEGMRSMILFTAWLQDQVEIHGGHDAPEAAEFHRLNDLMLPLCKGFCSHRVYEILGNDSLQVFGGAGYIKDFPIEQYIRDQKIDSLYEGTTHIQSLDLFFRKIARDQGATLQNLMGRIETTIQSPRSGEEMKEERAALQRALQDVQGIFLQMMQKVPQSLYHAGLHANRVLLSLAELVIGWRLVTSAVIAHEKLGNGTGRNNRAFYEGKIAICRYWCSTIFPGLTLNRKIIEKGTLELMDVDEEAF